MAKYIDTRFKCSLKQHQIAWLLLHKSRVVHVDFWCNYNCRAVSSVKKNYFGTVLVRPLLAAGVTFLSTNVYTTSSEQQCATATDEYKKGSGIHLWFYCRRCWWNLKSRMCTNHMLDVVWTLHSAGEVKWITICLKTAPGSCCTGMAKV